MNMRLAAAVLAGALWCVAGQAEDRAKGDPAKGQQIATQVCAACHGADGNSVAAANPTLAGQHPEYVSKQLMNFKAPAGGGAAERPSAVMTAMVANLTPDDMNNLAAYFSAQTPKARAARNPELVKAGQAIYRGGLAAKGVPACAACHSPNGAGMPAQFPRLSGQYAEYTAAQLKAFRAGERANDSNSMMRAVSAKLSDREIAAVAEYISGLR
jgi:cytochrome c553